MLEILFIIAQLFGVGYFIFDVLATRATTKKKIFKFNEISNIMSFCQYLCLAAWPGALCTSIALIRNRLFMRYKKVPLYILIIYIICAVSVNMLFVEKILDILPVMGITLIAIGLYQQNVIATKLCWLSCGVICITYDIYTGAFVSAFGEAVATLSVTITIIEMKRQLKKK